MPVMTFSSLPYLPGWYLALSLFPFAVAGVVIAVSLAAAALTVLAACLLGVLQWATRKPRPAAPPENHYDRTIREMLGK